MSKGSRKNKGHLKRSNALIFGIVIGIAIVVIFFKYYGEKRSVEPIKKETIPSTAPPFAKPEEKPAGVEPLPEIVEKTKPRIAIVIDDMGQDIKHLRELMDIDIPITIAVIPFLPHSKDVAEEANRANMEILLHIPMEPKDMKNHSPGRGSILTTMSEAEIREQVLKDIDAVPHIKGVNNHMGSKLTEDAKHMRVVLSAVKERGLFFLDSKTTPNSAVKRIAKEIGLNMAERQVFLDNEQDVSYIKGQINDLIKKAKKNNSAIAIGHPHPSTFAAIKEMSPIIKDEGIDVVPASSLVTDQ